MTEGIVAEDEVGEDLCDLCGDLGRDCDVGHGGCGQDREQRAG